MARFLAISSQVVHGSVGLSVIVPALQAQGHDVLALPTVLLSDHPGHVHVAGTRIAPSTLTALIEALAANGWLADVDAVLSGYLPTPEHVAFVAATVQRLRHIKPAIPYLCDPVIGDWPKGIYIDKHAARAIREHLVPLATMLTPNAFELGWLTECPVIDVSTAIKAIRGLPAGLRTVATSVPAGVPTALVNVVVAGRYTGSLQVAMQSGVPHGTGDLLSALVCGRVLSGLPFPAAVADAIPEVERVVSASVGQDHLSLGAVRRCVGAA